jgi:hypothetical protein
MAQKRSARRRGGKPKPSSARKNKTRSTSILSRQEPSDKSLPRPPHGKSLTPAQKDERTRSFKLVRLRSEGMSWRDAERYSGITVRTAQRYLPKAFFRDSKGQLQVTGYDRYVERMQLPTTHPGKLQIVRARGSHQRSLCGRWLNALKAAGKGDFGPIDAFPKNVFIDGYRLATGRYEVQRIVEVLAESDRAFDELYALAGAA